MKTINWPLWIGLATLLVLLGAIGYFVTMRTGPVGGSGGLVCDATTVRQRSAQTWDRMTAPSKALPPVDMRIFDTFTSTTSFDPKSTYSRHELSIKYRTIGNPLSRDEVLYTLAPPENAASQTSPSLAQLVAIGMEKAESFKTPGGGRRRPDMVQYFLPDGTAITSKTLLGIVHNDESAASFYSQNQVVRRGLQLFFQLDQSRNAKLKSCWVWDNKSRFLYSSGWSSRGGDRGILNLQPTGAYWRDAKVDLMIDIAHGASIDRDLKPDIGATANFGMGAIRVIDHIENRSSGGYGMSSSTGEIELSLHMRETTGTTLLLLGISPQCLIPLIDVSIHYKGQEKPENSYLNQNGTFALVSITKPVEQLEYLELKLYTKVERKVITIDHLPGISAVNAGKTDLLDLEVPAVNFTQSYEIQQFLEQMLMLSDVQAPGFSRTSPKWSFPIKMENPTVRDVLEVYMSAFPGTECVIDERDSRLQIRKPLNFAETMGEMFNNIGRAFSGRP